MLTMAAGCDSGNGIELCGILVADFKLACPILAFLSDEVYINWDSRYWLLLLSPAGRECTGTMESRTLCKSRCTVRRQGGYG